MVNFLEESAGPVEELVVFGAGVARWSQELGISPSERGKLLRPARGRVRPMRDVLMYATWSDGNHALAEIGRCFGVGYTSVVNARARAEAHLARNRRLRRKLKQAANDK